MAEQSSQSGMVVGRSINLGGKNGNPRPYAGHGFAFIPTKSEEGEGANPLWELPPWQFTNDLAERMTMTTSS